MTNILSISYDDDCTVIKRLKKLSPDGKTFSKFVIYVLEDWLAKKNMDSYLIGEPIPSDDAPLDVWEGYIKNSTNIEIKKILNKRRQINYLLETKIFA